MNSASFYCLKCESVPLIELAPKDNELKILATCQCHRQLLKAKAFFRYYYHPDHSQLKSEARKESSNTYIEKIIQNYQDYKDKFLNNCTRIKEEIINIYKTAILGGLAPFLLGFYRNPPLAPTPNYYREDIRLFRQYDKIVKEKRRVSIFVANVLSDWLYRFHSTTVEVKNGHEEDTVEEIRKIINAL